jgi:aryl-phospho-beta-D-glucosidase BglC (GH1 family)
MKTSNIAAKNRSWLGLALGCLLLLPTFAFAQLPTPTYGWNLGNTMEPPSGEGTWAPAATQDLINSVAAAGFNTIRIPVAWDSHANPRTRQIDPAWMARVKQVVDWCRAANLTVVINCHWDGGWFDSSGFTRFDSKVNAKVQSYWTQIANTFKTYDSHLLFCAANEPAADTAAKTAVLLRYYQTFVTAVRATGGNNTTRWLVLPGPSTSVDLTYGLMNTLPTDPTPGRLAIDVHYYPYQFTLMTTDATWGNMFYFWGQGYHTSVSNLLIRNSTWGEEADTLAEIQKMQTKFTSKGIPVLFGEFGAIRRTGNADLTGVELDRHLASRTYFDQKVVELCNQNGLKPFYWDDGGTNPNSFGLFDRNTAALVDTDSAIALTGGPAVPPP